MWPMCKSISSSEEDNICVQHCTDDTVHLYSVLYCSHCTVCTQVDFTARRQDMLSVFSSTWKEKHLLPMASETIASETIESETIESETIESETIESEIGFETRI